MARIHSQPENTTGWSQYNLTSDSSPNDQELPIALQHRSGQLRIALYPSQPHTHCSEALTTPLQIPPQQNMTTPIPNSATQFNIHKQLTNPGAGETTQCGTVLTPAASPRGWSLPEEPVLTQSLVHGCFFLPPTASPLVLHTPQHTAPGLLFWRHHHPAS